MSNTEALRCADALDRRGYASLTMQTRLSDAEIAAHIRRLVAEVESLRATQTELVEALNDLAAWVDGDVGGHMDEPHAAKVSRAALAKVGAT